MGGVIPIIFAISIVLFPTVIAQFFLNAKTEFLRDAATWTLQTFQNQTVYGITYFVLVFVFAYFYTSVIFHPDQVAENIQKQGGFIPGIRPGKQTADYLGWVVNRLLFTGALFSLHHRGSTGHHATGNRQHEPRHWGNVCPHHCRRYHRRRETDRSSAHHARIRSIEKLPLAGSFLFC